MSFSPRLEVLLRTAAPLPFVGRQHLRAIWEAHSSTDSRRQRERLIRKLSVARIVLATVTVLGSVAALTQYQYWWVYLIYLAIKLAATWRLADGLDGKITQLQDDFEPELRQGRPARVLMAQSALMLLLAPFWVVRLLGRARTRECTKLEFEISLLGKNYSFRDVAQDPRYRATVAVMDLLQACEPYRHILAFEPKPSDTRTAYLDWVARTRAQALEEIEALAASFETHPLGTPELADQGHWDQIEQKYAEHARLLDKHRATPHGA